MALCEFEMKLSGLIYHRSVIYDISIETSHLQQQGRELGINEVKRWLEKDHHVKKSKADLECRINGSRF